MATRLRAGSAWGTIVVAAVFGLVFTAFSAAQEKPAGAGKKTASKTELVTSKAAQGPQEGKDPNIKNDTEKNNPHMHAPAPANKGGGKTKGAGPYPCSIHVDNRTEWFIRVYMDGDYQATVNRYGDLYGLTGNGPTTLYGVAFFDDGSTKTWGPHVFDCPAYGSYTWRMLP